MINNFYKEDNRGFTLVELLVVITILGILASIGLATFTSAQARGRDAQRKSDLKQIANSLELYYQDYGKYPGSLNGQLLGCPSTTSKACVWGTGEFWDNKSIYFRVLPKDPTAKTSYNYQIVNGSMNQKFQIFAHLENSQDSEIISTTYSCGNNIVCNFAITSPNTSASE